MTAALIEPFDVFRLDGRVAIVTGASSGLGERFARVLHAAGALVVVAARRLDRLERLVAELGDGAVAVACDVADDSQCQALIDVTVERFGTLDLLVNNAGIGEPQPAETESPEVFRQTVAVNLTGTFVLSQQAAQVMLANGRGVIVNVASMLGVVAAGQIPFPSYTASKGGVIHLTRELAAQWARRGIRVNALAPGWFETEMTAEMFADERSMRWVTRNTPMGRPGHPHELDGALLFLASDASSFVTGQTLVIDGGWTTT